MNVIEKGERVLGLRERTASIELSLPSCLTLLPLIWRQQVPPKPQYLSNKRHSRVIDGVYDGNGLYF
jgi:hypothetical protein